MLSIELNSNSSSPPQLSRGDMDNTYILSNFSHVLNNPEFHSVTATVDNYSPTHSLPLSPPQHKKSRQDKTRQDVFSLPRRPVQLHCNGVDCASHLKCISCRLALDKFKFIVQLVVRLCIEHSLCKINRLCDVTQSVSLCTRLDFTKSAKIYTN